MDSGVRIGVIGYRIQETANYTGEAPQSVKVTIAKKPVNPTITLDQDSFGGWSP